MDIGKRKLIDLLKNKYNAYIQSNRTWYQISCPFCGDSPNPRSRHCNIRVSDGDNIVIVHCFQMKCTASGIMTKKHLRQMSVYDKDISAFLDRNYSSSKEIMSKTYDNDMAWSHCEVIEPSVAEYFYQRTTKELTMDRVLKYRIVPSIRDFYNKNKDRFSEEIKRRFKYLGSNDYIGFLNENGTVLEVRSIKKDVPKDKRFLKINLSQDEKIQFMRNKPYLINRNLGYLRSEYKVDSLVMTEGKFDCINAMETFVHASSANGIFVSSTISGFYHIINDISLKYPYLDLTIFADRDVMDNSILRIIKDISYRFKTVYVVRNNKGKDLGDFREPIEPEMYKLLENNINRIENIVEVIK